MVNAYDVIRETGSALAQARFDRGVRITEAEKFALNHNSMFGSASYPVAKCGRKWAINHTVSTFPLYATKREAVAAWETFIYMLIRLSGLGQQS